MKKISLLLVACMFIGIVFCACGNKTDSQDYSDAIVGTWKLTDIQDGEGNQYTLEDYCTEKDISLEGVEASYILEEDGIATGIIGDISIEGTYTLEETKLILTFNTQESSFTYNTDDDTLIAKDDNTGIMSIFTRQ